MPNPNQPDPVPEPPPKQAPDLPPWFPDVPIKEPEPRTFFRMKFRSLIQTKIRSRHGICEGVSAIKTGRNK